MMLSLKAHEVLGLNVLLDALFQQGCIIDNRRSFLRFVCAVSLQQT